MGRGGGGGGGLLGRVSPLSLCSNQQFCHAFIGVLIALRFSELSPAFEYPSRSRDLIHDFHIQRLLDRTEVLCTVSLADPESGICT